VIVTYPHTPETEGLWNAARFRLMKPTAYFINIGRGRTTRIDDLADAVERGVIAGCGLDVFETEPLPADHKLWTLPNVLLTPHVAVRDAENLLERRYQVLLENARRFAAGEPLRNVVDKAAWF
jgi:phosphoglycerate dehydrogenase-like enzyme